MSSSLADHGVRVGIGPIGWVNDDLREWGAGTPASRVMAEIAEAGYAGTEMSYVFPREPGALRAALKGHGLVLAGAYRWCNLANPAYQEEEIAAVRAHVDFCAAAGATAANLAEGCGSLHWDRKGERTAVQRLSEAQWDSLVSGLHACGRYARERGITLCFHPHAGTGIETEAEIDRLAAATDPELVGFCLDSGHIAYPGGDPVAVFTRHATRTRYVHAKDVRAGALAACRAAGLSFKEAIRRQVFTVPGAGDLDFPRLFKVLAASGYAGWLIVEAEQDPAVHNPLAVAKAAREYIRKVGGV